MDAMKLLEEDHRKVKKLLDEGDKTTEQATKRRTELLNELLKRSSGSTRRSRRRSSTRRSRSTRKDQGDRARGLRGAPRRRRAIAEELVALDPSDETWGAKFTVMKENIEHHIEEEEGEMFTKARQVLDEEELSEIADMMESRRDELRAEAAA